MPTIQNYRGIIPAISTPFTSDFRIDEPALRKLASWLAGHKGIVAVMTNGHTGEVFALTPDERAEVTRIVADELKGKLPVISSVVCEGLGDAAHHARLAVKAGAVGIDVMPPHHWLRFGFHPKHALDYFDNIYQAAGVLRVGNVGALDHASGELMWRLHVDAATRLCDALLPKMTARGTGRVVFIGSRVAAGMAGRGQYAATKAALVALAKSWAAEVAPHGVTVNVVSPAATATAMLDDPNRASVAPKLPPIGRLIQPAEIAALVSFLLSPAAAAITGQDIQICGGSSLNR